MILGDRDHSTLSFSNIPRRSSSADEDLPIEVLLESEPETFTSKVDAFLEIEPFQEGKNLH